VSRSGSSSSPTSSRRRRRPSKLVASGAFIHANPSDPVHYGKGKVSVYEHTVFIEPDFEVGPGPAFTCIWYRRRRFAHRQI
jgi:hypothetical protein